MVFPLTGRRADSACELGGCLRDGARRDSNRPIRAPATSARLSADGKLYTCLFATRGHDFLARLRAGKADEEIAQYLRSVWKTRDDRYSERRSTATPNLPKVEMFYVGG